jgi:hypothetical protein
MQAAALEIDRSALRASHAEAKDAERRGQLHSTVRPSGLIYPHAWSGASAERIGAAQRAVEDSRRLRAAMASQQAENGRALCKLGSALETSMQERLGATRANRQVCVVLAVGRLVARSAQCEVVVRTDWQLNRSLQR